MRSLGPLFMKGAILHMNMKGSILHMSCLDLFHFLCIRMIETTSVELLVNDTCVMKVCLKSTL